MARSIRATEAFALEDRCPHKAGPLSQGIVHGKSVTCPLHNWVISLETGLAQGATGQPLPAPQDIPGVGRFAVLGDPSGAAFIAFKPNSTEEPKKAPDGTPGHFGWRELYSGDWEKAYAFYAALFGFFLFASVGLPGLSGFAGEFLVLLGAFLAHPMVAGASTLVMILAAVYLLWMYQRIFTGPLSSFLSGLGSHLTDVTPTEILTLAPLAAMIVAFGILPSILTSSFAASVATFLAAAGSALP